MWYDQGKVKIGKPWYTNCEDKVMFWKWPLPATTEFNILDRLGVDMGKIDRWTLKHISGHIVICKRVQSNCFLTNFADGVS